MQSHFYQPLYSSHYAQAYSQYFPQNYNYTSSQPLYSSSTWSQSGAWRCSYRGCTFTGSRKALEIHKMDRHLIYPSGWKKHRKASDWDADPSLRGKPVPILGTSLNLDKPEELEAWLAERKRRWPTTSRVEEKKRKLEEANARGQLPETLILGKNQRQRTIPGDRTRFIDTSRGRGRGRSNLGWRPATNSGSKSASWQTPSELEVKPAGVTNTPLTSRTLEPAANKEDDDAPEIASSKVLVLQLASGQIEHLAEAPARKLNRPPLQPVRGVNNSFASRPALLRNLLLPEIRVTISNLSQAIKFLVENDFLEDVESKPGAASSERIQVLSSSDS